MDLINKKPQELYMNSTPEASKYFSFMQNQSIPEIPHEF